MGIHMRVRRYGLAAAPAAAALLAAAGFASAQTSAPADKTTAKDSTALEEIVVTAEKRESTVQKTPISMTAISEAEIQARGLEDFRSIAQETPGRLDENQRPRPNRIRDARTGCDRRLLADRGILCR